MIDNINEKLRSLLSYKRYIHCIGVQKTAIELAKKNNVDICSASVAGLIHDCAKGFNDNELLSASDKYSICLDPVSIRQPGLLHGPVGACIAKNEFLIDDEDIIHAIKYHTTGCENMSMLDKIIYIADYIEPGRDFIGVDSLRSITYKDINQGVLMALDNTIKYVIKQGVLIDILTIKARNFMLLEGFI